MQPLNTMAHRAESSTIGCAPASLKSMMASRRCPRTAAPSRHRPSPSGPRDVMVAVMAAVGCTSGGAPSKRISPHIPHMLSPAPKVRKPRSLNAPADLGPASAMPKREAVLQRTTGYPPPGATNASPATGFAIKIQQLWRGYSCTMEQAQAPVLDALAEYHRSERYGFSPPGHRQGRGADERALAVLGKDPYRDDILASGGLDDRMSRGGYLSQAGDLMAEAVGAESAFFSTCGSSLSVKAAMMAVAGTAEGGLLLGRDS